MELRGEALQFYNRNAFLNRNPFSCELLAENIASNGASCGYVGVEYHSLRACHHLPWCVQKG